MPVHDWTRVFAGVFHHFHNHWIPEIDTALNGGILPPDYYSMVEQVAGPAGPDVLTLQTPRSDEEEAAGPPGAVAVAEVPPKVRFTAEAEMDVYARKRKTVVIRHSSDD